MENNIKNYQLQLTIDLIISRFINHKIIIVNQDLDKQYKECEFYNILKSYKIENINYINENELINYVDLQEPILFIGVINLTNKNLLLNLINAKRINNKLDFIIPILLTSLNNKLLKHYFLKNEIDILNYSINTKIKNSTRTFLLISSWENKLKTILNKENKTLLKSELNTLQGNKEIYILPSLSFFKFEPNQLYLTSLINITQLNKNKFKIIDFGIKNIEYDNVIYNFISNKNKVLNTPQVLFKYIGN